MYSQGFINGSICLSIGKFNYKQSRGKQSFQEEGERVEVEVEVEGEDRWKELGVSEVLEEEAEADLKVGVPKVQQETS